MNNISINESYTFFILKPSTFERVSQDGRPLYLEIEEFLVKSGFETVYKKETIMSKEDIYYIYDQEYTSLIPILGESNVKKMMEVNSNLYVGKKCILLISRTEGENAINKALQLKGETFWPAKCSIDSIRYKYRDNQYDDFEIPKGQIVDLPCDNIIHSPKEISELQLIVDRWFS